MNKNLIISPSVLSADFSRLKEELKAVEDADATRLHLDVMDGHFVPNLTFGPMIVAAIRKLTDLHLECHLMINHPHRYIDEFVKAGSDTVVFHIEASEHISQDIRKIKQSGVKAGIALNPDTKPELIRPYLGELDHILVMSVFPGFGGQKFISSTLDTMKALVQWRSDHNFEIAVDGGVNLETIKVISSTGVDITVVGSGLFRADDISKRFEELLSEAVN